MAKINLNASEFGDFTVAFLLDKYINPDEIVIYNEDFNKLMNKIKMSTKSNLTQYYLNMDPNVRLYYKRIKPALEPGSNVTGVINIDSEVEKELKPKKPNLVKKIIKKLLRLEEISNNEIDLLLEYINEEE